MVSIMVYVNIGASNELDWRGCITHWLVLQVHERDGCQLSFFSGNHDFDFGGYFQSPNVQCYIIII